MTHEATQSTIFMTHLAAALEAGRPARIHVCGQQYVMPKLERYMPHTPAMR